MHFRSRIALITTLLALTFGAWAQARYAILNPPQATGGDSKVEVIEFFWYGCSHCYKLEPEVNSWLKRAPKDVVFKRIPAYPSEAWGEGARIYYTLEAMGLLGQYHQKVFDAIHKENVNLHDKRQREEWLKKNGIDVAKYSEAEKSFSVATNLARARQMTQSYKVDGVPRLVVNGKYYTSGEQAGGTQQVFGVVDQLVDVARRESPAAVRAPVDTSSAKK